VAAISGFSNGTYVNVAGSALSEANTTSAEVVGHTSTSLTYALAGVTADSAGAGGTVDYATNQNYFGQGAQGLGFADLYMLCGSTTTSPLDNQSYGGGGTYATGATFIMDWYGGGIKTENVSINHCNWAYHGYSADQSTFKNIRVNDNKVGFLFDSHSNQNVIDHLWSTGNDTTIEQNGAQELVIRDWTSDSEGYTSNTECPWVITDTYPNQNAGESVAYSGRFENFNGPSGTTYAGYVCLGVNSTSLVQNVSLVDPVFVGTNPGSTPITNVGVIASNADGIEIVRPRSYAPNQGTVGSAQIIGLNVLAEAIGTGSPRFRILKNTQSPASWFSSTSSGAPEAWLEYLYTDGNLYEQNLANAAGGNIELCTAGCNTATPTFSPVNTFPLPGSTGFLECTSYAGGICTAYTWGNPAGSGNVVASGSFTVGNLVKANSTDGTAVTDSGVPASSLSSLAVGCQSNCNYVLTTSDALAINPATGSAMSTANQPQFVRFYNTATRKLGNACITVATGASSSHADVGVYSISGSTLTLQWHTGQMSTPTSGQGICTTPTAYTLAAATPYYIAWCSDSTSVALAAFNAGGNWAVAAADGPANTAGVNATDVCTNGTLPGTATVTNISNTNTHLTVPMAVISN